MAPPSEIDVSVLDSLAEIPAAQWDACAVSGGADASPSQRPTDPFTTHRFLRALETSGSVGPRTGWAPHYLVARQNGEVIAVAPMYLKSHSQGEYIFDHTWAHAYENAGGSYYPKLQIAVPFTPVTGRRLLTRSGFETTGRTAVLQAAVELATHHHLSSLHITYCTPQDSAPAEAFGFLPRVGQQFHWSNAGYETFDDFLASLSSRKRKNIRRERSKAQEFGGTIEVLSGAQIQPEHWDAFWLFYQDTGARKWGTPYLTRAFFDEAQLHLRDDIALIMARRNGRFVAGALNFIGADTLFGRYWGCIEEHSCLHFEICYYRAIEFAIRHELRRVEAGAQGPHKLARGYMPVTTHSLHWINNPSFRTAVENYLRAEKDTVDEDIEILTEYGPFRKTGPQGPLE